MVRSRSTFLDFPVNLSGFSSPHRIIAVRKKLENQKQDLLAFVGEMEDKFSEISLQNKVSISYVQKICELHGLDQKKPLYWQKKGDFDQSELSVSGN